MTVLKVLGGYLEVEGAGGSGGGQPPGIWGGGNEGFPTHPIAPGGPPPGIWPSPGHPAHPIAPGGQPPGFWGGKPPPWVDNTLPGQPPGTWGGANEPFPTPPIYFPPEQPPTEPPTDTTSVEWKTGWTADSGWVMVGIIQTDAPIPTPSTAPSTGGSGRRSKSAT
jgi:hypothetical protein